MKISLSHILFILLTHLFVWNSFGQKNNIQKSIYFETAKAELAEDAKKVMDSLVNSLAKFQSYTIFINGFTDNVGNIEVNKKLSELRVDAAKNYFISKGIDSTVFSNASFGEEKPIADNTTEAGKRLNRRVEISIVYIEMASIKDLFAQLERIPQEFCIHPTRDTVLRCEQGTIVYVKANSFKISKSCSGECITIKVKEDFLKSDMILDNLTTTSNGKIIETQGMVYTEANDCSGRNLKLLKEKDLVIMIPAAEINPDAKIFQGNRNTHDEVMNWTVNNNSVLTNFTIEELNYCHSWLCLNNDCRFFFCKIKLFFNRVFRKNRKNNGPDLSQEMPPKCEALANLYEKYGVSNLDDLTYAINKPLLDSFNVKNVKELQDTLAKVNKKNIELSYLNRNLNYEDFKYYVYNTSRLGWSNVDVFANIKEDQMVTMKTNLAVASNVDCKLVFKDRRFVIPATNADKNYVFEKMPKGEKVWVVAIKYEEGKPYVFLEETSVENTTINIQFEQLTLDELKEKLKVLD